ncbi:MAG TPA: glycosyltransferase family 39 protein [Steroidobacteraceae bacterium]|nr:glycosyltransferase family 39 protein [Steroidobacteraceae bacterium]
MSAANGTGARSRAFVAGILLLVACSWLALGANRGLFNPDEGRYAEIPREMLATGDWVIPRLNGLVYIEKPPLQYWATALTYMLCGTHPWSARLYAELTGLGTILVTAWLALRLWGRAAAWRSGIMAGSSLMIMLMSHQLTLDMGLTFFTTLMLAGFCIAQDARTEPRMRARWMWLSWASAAAAFLTKGLVAGVLPVLTLALYSLLHRDLKPWRRLGLIGGVPLFLLLVTPWFVAIQHRLPQFFDFFVVREHFQRYLTRIEQRYEPWWFFIEVLLIGCLPWLLPSACALARAWRATAPREHFDARLFLWVWCVVVLVFFSASDSKLIPYILPMFPALALLTGSAAESSLRADLRATGLLLIGIGIAYALGAALLPHLVHDPERVPYFLRIRWPLVCMAVAALGGGVLVRRSPGDSVRLTLLIGAASYLGFICVLWAARALEPLYSGAPLAAQLPPSLRAAAPVYSVRTYDQSLTFYLGRIVTLVEWRGELDFGLSLEPGKGIASLQEFVPIWRAQPQALAVMEPVTFEALERAGLPMVVRARTPHELIVSRR